MVLLVLSELFVEVLSLGYLRVRILPIRFRFGRLLDLDVFERILSLGRLKSGEGVDAVDEVDDDESRVFLAPSEVPD